MHTVTLARHAMATRFEMVLHGENAIALRAAGEEALNEIERLEARLSLFRPTSEIAHLNSRAAREAVRVTPGLFALLQHARRLHEESGGVFDITIAPLLRCWGFIGGGGKTPDPAELAEARTKVGMHLIQLDQANYTVRFARAGVMLDLGAIGKGYAVGQAAEILREAGVSSALIHGGTSSVCAIGAPPEADAWNVAIQKPGVEGGNRNDASELLASIPLRDEAMSVSAIWGKCFESGGKTFGHVIDPRTAAPVSGAVLAAIVLPCATETDALSTALLTVGAAGHEKIFGLRPQTRTLLITGREGQFTVESKGISLAAHSE
jgi:FAD:protein FMN transferase